MIPESSKEKPSPLKESNRIVILPAFFFIISSAVFSLWILGFWPAIMTIDSANSWTQIQTGSYSNWHPYLYTLYIQTISSISSWSIAWVSIFQILLTSALGAWTFSYTYQNGNRPITLLFFLFFIFSPAIGLQNITIWKDIFFSQLVVFWALTSYFYIQKKQEPRYTTVTILTILLFLTITVRHNGIVFLLCIPVLFYSTRILSKQKAFFLFSCSLLLYIISITIVPALLRVDMDIKTLRIAYKIQIAASILEVGTYNYNEKKAGISLRELEQFIPITELQANYHCQDSNAILFNKNFHKELLKDTQNFAKFNTIINRLILDNLKTAFMDRLCIFSSTMRSEGNLYYNLLDTKNTTERLQSGLNIEQKPISKTLNLFLMKCLTFSKNYPVRVLYWNLWVPLLTFILSTYYFFRKKNKALLTYSLIIILQVPFLFLTITANDFRYFYFLFLSFFFFVPLIFVKKIK